jgi:hypothetical protein
MTVVVTVMVSVVPTTATIPTARAVQLVKKEENGNAAA